LLNVIARNPKAVLSAVAEGPGVYRARSGTTRKKKRGRPSKKKPQRVATKKATRKKKASAR
jgi:hypothetical protein